MAIVKMNKFTLLTFGSQKEKLLHRLQGFAKVELINLQDEALQEKYEVLKDFEKDQVDSENAKNEENLSKAKSALTFLTNYMPKKSGLKALEDSKDLLTVDELEAKVKDSNWEDIYKKVKEKEEELNRLESRITRLESDVHTLSPWKELDVSFSALDELTKTSYFIGTIAKQYEEELVNSLKDSYVEIISRNSNEVNVLIIVHSSDYEETLNTIRAFGFSAFKTEQTDVPFKLVTDYLAEVEETKSKIFFLKEEMISFEGDLKTLEHVYDYYSNVVERNKVSTNFLKTKNTVTIQGWVAKHNSSKLESLCKDELGENYFIEFSEVEEDEVAQVPIKLKNGLLNRTFEAVTEMYSYPRYDEVDPTPLLVPFYLIFFGMMVADAGYGLVMLIASFAALKFLKMSKKNNDFARFFLFLSFPTIVFGFIYGSFFGDAIKIPGLLDPTKDVNTILVLSLVLGVVQILFGLLIKAYVLIKSNKKKDAFYDVGAWLITLISIGVFAGYSSIGLPAFTKYIAIAGMIFGAVVIILTGGRAEETKGAQIGQGLYALYGITGYIGDLVSYTRLMALGLSGGSIAGALNMLIHQLPGIAAFIIAPVLFLLAHIFNLLLGLLGAYVHTARLQYVEYFSKFYEGGGRPFTPFKASEKYMNLKDN